MTIEMKKEGSALTIALEGRLDTVTSPELEKALADSLADVTSLVFDLKNLEYVSSAGLRVLMTAQKALMPSGGKVAVAHPNDMVRGILDMTGLSGVFEIQ